MKRFKNILFVGRPEESEGCALVRAATLAENNQARLTVLWVIEPYPTATPEPSAAPTADPVAALSPRAQRARLHGLVDPWRERVKIETRFVSGSPSIEAIREVCAEGRDLVVTCAGSSGVMDRFFGSEDLNLLRRCPSAVWLCKPDSPPRYHRILVAVDPDDAYPADELQTRHELNLRLLEIACSLALSEFAELHVVHVWNVLGETAMRGAFLTAPEEQIRDYVNAEQLRRVGLMEQLMGEIKDRLGEATLDYLKPVQHLPKGWPRDEIPALAERIGVDLAILGTVARSGIPGLLMGNTAEILLHRLSCSVLALKPAGFVTPMTF